MREIKFRAWNSNRWLDPEDFALTLAGSFMYHDYEAGWRYGGNDEYEDVKIMQYTGLKDKNGVEIYEGDIVDIDHPAWTERGEIVFREGAFAFMQLKDWPKERAVVYLHSVKFETQWKLRVIGNIYENPELVK